MFHTEFNCFFIRAILDFPIYQKYYIFQYNSTTATNLKAKARAAKNFCNSLVLCYEWELSVPALAFWIHRYLVLEFEMWRHFGTKQKSKSFTLCHCVWLCLILCTANILLVKKATFRCLLFPIRFQCTFGSQTTVF